ncbi:uncharacterized [Tachysurus ichikawai]
MARLADYFVVIGYDLDKRVDSLVSTQTASHHLHSRLLGVYKARALRGHTDTVQFSPMTTLWGCMCPCPNALSTVLFHVCGFIRPEPNLVNPLHGKI